MLTPDSFHQLAAVVWLGILLAVVVGYTVLLVRRSPYTLWEDVLYVPTYLYGRIVWRVHFTNSPPPEMRAGAVLVANHRSSVDPFFVQLAAGRRVHWMVAREYCEHAIFGPLLRTLQVIPTNRSGMDTGATKQAIRLAKEGRLVGMFPEGRLNHTRDPLVSIRPGAALVAYRAGVPLIPLHIKGSPYRREVWSPIFMPARVLITFGRPVDPRAFAEQNAAATSKPVAREAETEPVRAEPVGTEPAATALIGTSNGDSVNAEPVKADALYSEAAKAESAGGGTDASGVVTPQTGSGRNGATEPVRRTELAMAEEMIMQWGRQVVAMAGHPNWPIEVAGRSRLARTPKESL